MEKENSNWLTKHIDTVIILSAFASSIIWMNGKFSEIDSRFNGVEKDISILKTVLIMKNVMPAEFAKNEEKK